MSDPFQIMWDTMVAELADCPAVVTLPRDEVLRLCKMMYIHGITDLALGILALDFSHKDSSQLERDHLRSVLLARGAAWCTANMKGDKVEQMVATMRAHELKTEIVKVQLPTLGSPGVDAPALVYSEGRKNKALIPVTDDLTTKMAGSVKGYFHATWTGETWVLKDRAPAQSW